MGTSGQLVFRLLDGRLHSQREVSRVQRPVNTRIELEREN